MRSVSAGSVGSGAGNVVFALALRTRAVFCCRGRSRTSTEQLGLSDSCRMNFVL